MMEFRYDHVHFLTRDARAMADFFERVLGLELLSWEEDLRIRGYRPGDAPDAVAPALTHGLDHLGVAVEDVASAVARLEKRGAEVLSAPAPAGAGGRMIAFIKGPDNVRIKVCERPRPSGKPA